MSCSIHDHFHTTHSEHVQTEYNEEMNWIPFITWNFHGKYSYKWSNKGDTLKTVCWHRSNWVLYQMCESFRIRYKENTVCSNWKGWLQANHVPLQKPSICISFEENHETCSQNGQIPIKFTLNPSQGCYCFAILFSILSQLPALNDIPLDYKWPFLDNLLLTV